MPHSIRTLFVLPDTRNEGQLAAAVAQAAPAVESMLQRGYAVDFAAAGDGIPETRLDRLDETATGAAERLLGELETRTKITRAQQLDAYDTAEYSGVVFLGAADQDWSKVKGAARFVNAGFDDNHMLGAIGPGVGALQAADAEKLRGRHIAAPETMHDWISDNGATPHRSNDPNFLWADGHLVTAQNDDAADYFAEALISLSDGEFRIGDGGPAQGAPVTEPVKAETGYQDRAKHGLADNQRGTQHPKEQYEPERYRKGKADPTPDV